MILTAAIQNLVAAQHILAAVNARSSRPLPDAEHGMRDRG
jgi:hypothetical protein